MDLDTEFAVLYMYDDWLTDSSQVAYEEHNLKMKAWIDALRLEVWMDSKEVFDEYLVFNLYLEKDGHSEWVVKVHEGHPDYCQTSESHLSEDETSSSSQIDDHGASRTQSPPSWDL